MYSPEISGFELIRCQSDNQLRTIKENLLSFADFFHQASGAPGTIDAYIPDPLIQIFFDIGKWAITKFDGEISKLNFFWIYPEFPGMLGRRSYPLNRACKNANGRITFFIQGDLAISQISFKARDALWIVFKNFGDERSVRIAIIHQTKRVRRKSIRHGSE